MRTAYDAVLFDFDGVLVDSEPLHFACWREVLARRGVDFPWAFYAEQCIGVSDEEMRRLLVSLAQGVDEWLPPAAAEKRALFRERTLAGALVSGEVREMLRALRLPLAVVTSSSRLEVEPILIAEGIHEHFQARVYRESVTRMKPHPEPYRTAAALVGAARPLVVEDSEMGARSAAAAGFDCLRIERQSDVAREVKLKLGDALCL
jgi:HAD superfamily hydrolase (TIGR01509 family)